MEMLGGKGPGKEAGGVELLWRVESEIRRETQISGPFSEGEAYSVICRIC